MSENLDNYFLARPNDPILMRPTQKFDFENPPMDPEELANQLLTVMAGQGGIGLSANQVGLPYSVFVIHGDPFACFNPMIVDVSEETADLEEGCLTFPGLYVTVTRPKHIRLRFTTIRGNVETQKFTGMTARIIQHEMDHLEGKLFFNRVSKYHRDKAFRKHNLFLRHPERFQKKDIVRTDTSTVPQYLSPQTF